jgi:hypothetical protein
MIVREGFSFDIDLLTQFIVCYLPTTKYFNILFDTSLESESVSIVIMGEGVTFAYCLSLTHN